MSHIASRFVLLFCIVLFSVLSFIKELCTLTTLRLGLLFMTTVTESSKQRSSLALLGPRRTLLSSVYVGQGLVWLLPLGRNTHTRLSLIELFTLLWHCSLLPPSPVSLSTYHGRGQNVRLITVHMLGIGPESHTMMQYFFYTKITWQFPFISYINLIKYSQCSQLSYPHWDRVCAST